MIKRTVNEVRGMKEFAKNEVIEVMGSAQSVRRDEITEVIVGVKEVMGSAESVRKEEVTEVTAGAKEVNVVREVK